MIARVLESRGIATVTLNMFPEVAVYVRAPRTIITKFPFGSPFGDPGNKALHQAVLKECFNILEQGKKTGEIRELSYKWREKL